MFIVLIHVVNNQNIYRRIFNEQSVGLYNNGSTSIEITDDYLSKITLGIFGSMKATSDIDVGIRYAGVYDDSYTPILAYIVSLYEDLFLYYFGKNTLDFDIEPYADMYLINKGDGDEYLSTKELTEKQFKEHLAPLAFASMWRNIYTAKQHAKEHDGGGSAEDDPWDVEWNQGIIKANNLERNHINDNKQSILSSIDFYSNKEGKITDDIDKIYNDIDKWLEQYTNVMTEYQIEFTKGERLANRYCNDLKNYNEQRTAYYDLVSSAENYIQNNDISPETTPIMIQKIGMALLYRAESYVCTPTIMHVVQMDQAASVHDKRRYQQIIAGDLELQQHCESKPKEALCKMGKYGFLASILENTGYLYRFNKDQSKIEKYLPRLISGIHYFFHLNERKGGSKKRSKKNRKSKKNKKRTKKRSKKVKY